MTQDVRLLALETAAAEEKETVLYPPPGSPAGIVMDTIRRMLAPDVDQGRRGDVPMRLEIGWIDSPEYNAWADRVDDTDVIGLNIGIFSTLVGFTRALLTHHYVFPRIAGPFFRRDQPFIYKGGGCPGDFPLSGWPEGEFTDPIREALAKDLIWGAIWFVAFHEFAHVYNGHVDYLRASFKLHRLDEAGPRRDGFTGLTSQTLEFDADLRAMQGVLGLFLQPKNSRDADGKTVWTLPTINAFGSIDQALGLASVSVSMALVILSSNDELRHPDVRARAHPPGMVRFGWVGTQFATVLHRHAGRDFLETAKVALAQWPPMMRAYNEILPGRPVLLAEDLSHYQAFSDELMKEYTDEWERLHPHLDRLKRGGVLAQARTPDGML